MKQWTEIEVTLLPALIVFIMLLIHIITDRIVHRQNALVLPDKLNEKL